MDLVPGFQALLQGISAAMTAPSFASLCTIASGWLFSGRGIVTRMIVAAGPGATKHFSAYHWLFSAASWSLDAVGLALFTMIAPSLDGVVMLGLDDTLARKRGVRMFGTGMHHDPLASSRSRAFVRWGHSWVVFGVIVSLPSRPGHWIFLPLFFRLYLNRQSPAQHKVRYRTRPELGVEMLRMLCGSHENRCFHVVADSAYGGRNVLARLPENCDLTSRLLLAARLHDAKPERLPGTNGRPRKRGQRVASPAHMLQGRCRRLSLSIYGRSYRSRIADQVIRWYAMRWSVEVSFRDSKQCLGFEEPQGGGAHRPAGHASPHDGRALVRQRRPSALAAAGPPLVSGEGRPVVHRHACHPASGERAKTCFSAGTERPGFQKAGPAPGKRGRDDGVMTMHSGHRVPAS